MRNEPGGMMSTSSVIKGRCWAMAQTLKVNPIARAKAARTIVSKEKFIADSETEKESRTSRF
jgi:hypothetical protein